MSLLMKRPGASPLAEPPKSAVLRWHTGSGKTLAYLLPLLARVDPRERAVQCVIVVPSRELCLQTLRLLKAVSGHGRANKKGNALRVSSAMGRVNTRMGRLCEESTAAASTSPSTRASAPDGSALNAVGSAGSDLVRPSRQGYPRGVLT